MSSANMRAPTLVVPLTMPIATHRSVQADESAPFEVRDAYVRQRRGDPTNLDWASAHLRKTRFLPHRV